MVNSGDGTVSVIDPSNMHLVNTWSAMAPAENTSGNTALTIAPGMSHRVLIDVYYPSVIFGGAIHVLNLDTGNLSCAGSAWCINGTDLAGFTLAAMAATPDGSKVFLASMIGGANGMLDFTANNLTLGVGGKFHDASADADANIFAASFGIFDPHVSRTSIMAYEPHADAGNQSLNNLIGEKLNPAGSLLFVPQTYGVAIFDVHTGRLARHLALPESLPFDLNTMALDDTGTKMFLISNSGITIAQLFQSPLSLASVSPVVGPQGTKVTVRGSGFQNGATAVFGTMQVSAILVDQNTLTATVPGLSPGPIRITVTNPDGDQYSFDNAFTVQ